MARGRERAKRRRRERQSGAPEDAARAAGLGDGSVEDSGLGDGTPAPDPLKHASAEVDQAHLAEAGADRGLSGDAEHREHEDDPGFGVAYNPAADEVEGDQPVVRRGDLAPSVREETAPRTGKPRARFIAFLGHCVDELRRVQWPDRKQVFQATAVVLGFVVIAGGYLGLMDAIFKPLVQAIL